MERQTVYRSVIRTKRMIRQAFIEALTEHKQIEQITVGEICRRADIAKSTFYYHYDDIYDVEEEIADEAIRTFTDILEDLEKTEHPDFAAYINRAVEFLKENENVYRRIVFSSSSSYFVDKLKRVFVRKLTEHPPIAPFFADPNERAIHIRLLVNALTGTVLDYYRGATDDATLDEIGTGSLKVLGKLME